MTPATIVAALLALAVVVGWIRLVLNGFAAATAWRTAALFVLQPVVAALLFAALFGGAGPRGEAALVVATAGAPRLVATAPGEALVGLPEAAAVVGAAPVPDLATALRARPEVARLRIVGDGLPARDRDAARTLPLRYDRPPPPAGLVELIPPAPAAPGDDVAVAVRAGAAARIVLVDPAGRIVDAGVADGDGRLVLHGAARDAGAVLFTLRVDGRAVASVPVVTLPAAGARAMIVAAAPGPEVKFLRRWASDAGLTPAARVAVGGGVTLGDPGAAITAAALARIDLAILDDRSWAGLDGAARAALAAAVRGGMGLVVRVTGPVPRGWQVLGLRVAPGGEAVPLRLPPSAPSEAALAARRGPGSRDAPAASLAPLGEIPVLTRIAAGLDAGVPLLRDARGTPYAAWRTVGRGRVAVTTVVDSFALVPSGNGDVYAALWSAIASTIGRAAAVPAPPINAGGLAFAGERVALCGFRSGARVVAPDDTATTLVVDPAAGGCAGYWPRIAGWHRIDGGGVFYVQRADVQRADALPGVRRARDQAATALLAGDRLAPAATAVTTAPAPSWRWLLGFLLAAGVLWWLERSRVGRRPAKAP